MKYVILKWVGPKGCDFEAVAECWNRANMVSALEAAGDGEVLCVEAYEVMRWLAGVTALTCWRRLTYASRRRKPSEGLDSCHTAQRSGAC